MLNRRYLTVVLAFAAIPLWSQGDSSGAQPAATASMETDDRMVTPTPVGGEGYSLAFVSEMKSSNYLRGGLSLGSTYDDNVLPSSSHRISDVSYSVWPTITLAVTRSRLRWDLSYSPGFTFYERHTSLNEADQHLGLSLEYRLSPHVTLSLRDSFVKTSNGLSLSAQSDPAPGSELLQSQNNSVVPPVTDRISNFGNMVLTYQFGANAMVGGKGTLSGLWYPNRATSPGLFDSTAEAAEGFYARRLSEKHYIGVTYDFQRLLAPPSKIQTQTHSVFFFYTIYLRPTLSASLFGGPEYSSTQGGAILPLHSWSPAAGGSLGWQGARSSFAASYARRISEGGGLSGAIRSINADAFARWQFAKTMTAGLGGNYAINNILYSLLGSTGGHTISGTLSLERSLGKDLSVRIGYTRLHQSYSNIAAISNTPNRNQAWVSLSYQFQRPLGR